MDAPIKTRDDISIRALLENQATYLKKNGETYYFLPFYFKDDGTDMFEMFHLEHLPEELKEAITLLRDHSENFITISHDNSNCSEHDPPASDNPWHDGGDNKEI